MSCRITLLVVWVQVWYPNVFASFSKTYIYDVIIGLRRGISSHTRSGGSGEGAHLCPRSWWEPPSPPCPASRLPLPAAGASACTPCGAGSYYGSTGVRTFVCACSCVHVSRILISPYAKRIGNYDQKNNTMALRVRVGVRVCMCLLAMCGTKCACLCVYYVGTDVALCCFLVHLLLSKKM